MKQLIFTFLFILFSFALTGEAHAFSQNTPSAALTSELRPNTPDPRVTVLKKYLLKYNSPMANSAQTFVQEADRYNLDWRLVASIAGLESGFGHHIPYNSYNGWGWGVYGTNVIRFSSWDEGISIISKGLRENYLRDIEYSDPYIIGPTYAASPTWAQRVSFFMRNIEAFEASQARDLLSISL